MTVNLVVVAHPDDEILGFGGGGHSLVIKGEKVVPIILSGKVGIRHKKPKEVELLEDIKAANECLGFESPVIGDFPNIRMNTVPHVELVQFIETQLEKYQPSRVFTHHPSDLNDDHVQVSRACQAAIRLFQRRDSIKPVNEFYYLEILSATDWSLASGSSSFQPNTYVELKSLCIERKIKALGAYRDVMRPYPHPRSIESLKGLALYRGSQSGLCYAEAYQMVFRRGF